MSVSVGCVSLYLNPRADSFLHLGERSKKISQIWFVWGKAVALSRYHGYPTIIGLRECISPDQSGKFALYLNLEALPRAIGVNCDAVHQGAKACDEGSAVVLGCRMIRQGNCQSVYCLYILIQRGRVKRSNGWSLLECSEFGLNL